MHQQGILEQHQDTPGVGGARRPVVGALPAETARRSRLPTQPLQGVYREVGLREDKHVVLATNSPEQEPRELEAPLAAKAPRIPEEEREPRRRNAVGLGRGANGELRSQR